VSVTLRAAVITAPGGIEVREFPRPRLEPGQVLLRVEYSGICGTDKHTFRGETEQYVGTPHARSVRFPLIPGHETVGIVEEVAGDVADSEGVPVAPGDRIVPAANVPCGECWACRDGLPYYSCERLEDYGNSLDATRPPHLLGGWAEAMVLLPGTPLFRVPDALPSHVAVLTEEMSVTHGLDTARAIALAKGGSHTFETAAILGVGPLGLCHLIRARMLGLERLFAIDLLPGRLATARRFGAELTLNAEDTTEEDRRAAIGDATAGRGPDVVVDCSGDPSTFAEALRLVRYGGTVIEAGAFVQTGTVPVDPAGDVTAKDVAVIGVGGERSDLYLPMLRALEANLDAMPLASVVTHRMALDEAARAIALSASDDATKVVFAPNGVPDVRGPRRTRDDREA
jgi:L-iditol 2-dehydrogenase